MQLFVLIFAALLAACSPSAGTAKMTIDGVQDYIAELRSVSYKACHKALSEKTALSTFEDGDNFTPYMYENRWRLSGLVSYGKLHYDYLCMIDAKDFDSKKTVFVLQADLRKLGK